MAETVAFGEFNNLSNLAVDELLLPFGRPVVYTSCVCVRVFSFFLRFFCSRPREVRTKNTSGREHVWGTPVSKGGRGITAIVIVPLPVSPVFCVLGACSPPFFCFDGSRVRGRCARLALQGWGELVRRCGCYLE